MAQKKHAPKKQDSQAPVEFDDKMSPNLIQVPKFATVQELMADFNKHNTAIHTGIKSFVGWMEETTKELSYMQALLSKKGTNHEIVIQARKEGHNIQWWSDYFATVQPALGVSLREAQRRVKAYRAGELGDGSKKKDKPNPDHQFNKAERNTVVAAAVAGRELADAIEAGRDGKEEAKAFRKIQHGDRLNDVLAAAQAAPDYHKGYNDAMRGLKALVEAFEKRDASKTLPADLRKLVRDTRKEFFGTAVPAPKRAKSAAPLSVPFDVRDYDPRNDTKQATAAKQSAAGGLNVYKVREVTNPAGNTFAVVKDEVVVKSDYTTEEAAFDALDEFKSADEKAKAVTA
jgi:hypothetical protein